MLGKRGEKIRELVANSVSHKRTSSGLAEGRIELLTVALLLFSLICLVFAPVAAILVPLNPPSSFFLSKLQLPRENMTGTRGAYKTYSTTRRKIVSVSQEECWLPTEASPDGEDKTECGLLCPIKSFRFPPPAFAD